MRPKISACLVLFNEGKKIRRCLESIKGLVDEIIVIHDGPCRDRTIDICKEFRAKIYIENFVGSPEYHRITLLERAKNDWILQIDADEILSKELKAEILKLELDKDGYFTKRVTEGSNFEKYYLRLYDRKKIKFLGLIHHEAELLDRNNFCKLKNYIYHNHPPKKDNPYNWTKKQAEEYLKEFSSIPKYNWPEKEWPRNIRFRRKHVFLSLGLLPFRVFFNFSRKYSLRTGIKQAKYSFLLSWSIVKLKFGRSRIKHRLKRSRLFVNFLYLMSPLVLRLRRVHSLTLEVSSTCNLRCVFCPVGNGKIPLIFMDIKTHKKVIDLLPKSIKRIRYSYRGDATMNKDFVKMIKYSHSKGFKTDLSTNGMLVDKYISELVNSGLGRIIFAIDGATQEVQSKYRVGSDLEKTKINIKKLVEARRNSKNKFPKEIIIQSVVSQHNEFQIEELDKMAKDSGVDKIKFKTLATSLGSEFLKGKDFQKDFLPKNKKYQRKGQDILMCPFIWETVILANGDVSICCNDYYGEYIAGNVLKERSFKKVVYNKKYMIFRKKILKRKLPICKSCPITGEYWIPKISKAFR